MIPVMLLFCFLLVCGLKWRRRPFESILHRWPNDDQFREKGRCARRQLKEESKARRWRDRPRANGYRFSPTRRIWKACTCSLLLPLYISKSHLISPDGRCATQRTSSFQQGSQCCTNHSYFSTRRPPHRGPRQNRESNRIHLVCSPMAVKIH